MSITFSPADEFVEMIRQFDQPSMIALVSISELFLRTARGLFAPVVGSRHTMREYFLPSESPRSLIAADGKHYIAQWLVPLPGTADLRNSSPRTRH